MDASALTKAYRRALKNRTPFESGYQECYDYALPGRTSFFQRSPATVIPDIFDETAIIGVQEFASRIQQGLIPNYARWIELEAGSDVPREEREEVNLQLEDITETVFNTIINSNFSQEANECLIDIALGTACMEVTEGDAVNPVIFSAIPLPELALATGPDDQLDNYYRGRMMRLSAIKRKWPDASLPDDLRKIDTDGDDDPMIEVVRASIAKEGMDNAHDLCAFLPKYDHKLYSEEVKGIGSNPFIGFRWMKVAGEAWGRGPLFNTMPAVRTANLVVQMVLENAEMAIAGIYQAEDDGVVSINNIRLLPGTVIPIAPGSTGLRALSPAGDFDVSQLVLSEMRANIRKALYNETLGSPDTTPMSATEVQQRMADLSRQIGSAFGRLQVEFVNRVVQRVIYILRKQGKIELPVVNGRQIAIKSTSPLAQAQAVEDINAVNNMLSLVGQHFGPQVVTTEYDTAQVADYLREKFGVPVRLQRTDKGKQDLVQNAMTLQQQQQPTGGMIEEQGGGGNGA